MAPSLPVTDQTSVIGAFVIAAGPGRLSKAPHAPASGAVYSAPLRAAIVPTALPFVTVKWLPDSASFKVVPSFRQDTSTLQGWSVLSWLAITNATPLIVLSPGLGLRRNAYTPVWSSVRSVR